MDLIFLRIHLYENIIGQKDSLQIYGPLAKVSRM